MGSVRSVPREPGLARAIVLAPGGRDAAVAQTLLREAGIPSTLCTNLEMFEAYLSDKAGFAIVAEEAVASADLHGIAAWVSGQPNWSDFAFIVLTQRDGGQERYPIASRLSDILRNVTFLERPFHPTALVSVARTALRGRERQHDARSRIEELHESAARLRTALLAGHLGAWELDLDRWSLTCSDTCKAVFGRKPEEPFTYLDMLGSVHPEDRSRIQVALQRAVDTASDFATEYRTVRPGGGTRWAEVRARVVRGQSGQGPRLIGVASDITGRKAAEASWRQINETLEQRVPEAGVNPVSRAAILIVDDDALVAMSTAGMLGDLGHEVIETHSAARAMAVLRDRLRVDLMITDVSMPGMTGLQLAQAARKLRPDLPILLATGYGELPSGETMSLPCLGKPYTQSQLAAEIAKLLPPRTITV